MFCGMSFFHDVSYIFIEVICGLIHHFKIGITTIIKRFSKYYVKSLFTYRYLQLIMRIVVCWSISGEVVYAVVTARLSQNGFTLNGYYSCVSRVASFRSHHASTGSPERTRCPVSGWMTANRSTEASAHCLFLVVDHPDDLGVLSRSSRASVSIYSHFLLVDWSLSSGRLQECCLHEKDSRTANGHSLSLSSIAFVDRRLRQGCSKNH